MSPHLGPPGHPGQPRQLRRMNRRAVVERIRRGGPASRAEIARDTGLSAPTVGHIADQLISDKLLEAIDSATWDALQHGSGEASMGRPSQVLRLDRIHPTVVAMDINKSMTHLAALPAASGDDASWSVSFRTPKRAATFLSHLRRAKRRLRLPRPWCVVATVPGLVDQRTGHVLHAAGLPWMTGTTLIEMFAKLWPTPVILTNPAHARAAALAVDQAMNHSFLLVDFGDDVCSAAVINGRMTESANATHGELAHRPVKGCLRSCWCGEIGCVNTLASRAAMVESFSKVKRGRATWRSLISHVKREGIGTWLKPTLIATGESIAAAVNVLGVNNVVLTGAMAELGDVVVDRITQTVRQSAIWSRFGQINVAAHSPSIAAGLVAQALDRVMLPDSIE